MSLRVLIALLAVAVVLGAVGGATIMRTVDGRASSAPGGSTAPPSATVPGTPSPSPSPTAVSTPEAPQSAFPGGPPDAASTGVPKGTTLSDYTGPTTITAAGTVIDAKKITTCLVIKADNVTIKNSLIQATCLFDILADNGNTGLQITDVEIDGLANTAGDSAVSGGGYTCLRCNIHGTVDGFKAGTDVTIQDSWIHDLAMTADSHNDGIQSLGTRNVTITGNLLGGGAFTVYGGYQAGADTKSKVSDIAITNNYFSTKVHPKSGAYGPLTSDDSPVVATGNTWYDGPDAGQPLG